MKRDFLLGGTKLPTGGAVRGAGGAMSPPVFMLKEALKHKLSTVSLQSSTGKVILNHINYSTDVTTRTVVYNYNYNYNDMQYNNE